MKNIIVYGLTIEKAFSKLQDLLDNMDSKDIRKVTKTFYNTGIFTIELKNGDYYKAISANDNARGCRWQYAYIDKDIDNEVLDNVVACKFIPENLNKEWNPNIKTEDYYEFF